MHASACILLQQQPCYSGIINSTSSNIICIAYDALHASLHAQHETAAATNKGAAKYAAAYLCSSIICAANAGLKEQHEMQQHLIAAAINAAA